MPTLKEIHEDIKALKEALAPLIASRKALAESLERLWKHARDERWDYRSGSEGLGETCVSDAEAKHVAYQIDAAAFMNEMELEERILREAGSEALEERMDAVVHFLDPVISEHSMDLPRIRQAYENDEIATALDGREAQRRKSLPGRFLRIEADTPPPIQRRFTPLLVADAMEVSTPEDRYEKQFETKRRLATIWYVRKRRDEIIGEIDKLTVKIQKAQRKIDRLEAALLEEDDAEDGATTTHAPPDAPHRESPEPDACPEPTVWDDATDFDVIVRAYYELGIDPKKPIQGNMNEKLAARIRKLSPSRIDGGKASWLAQTRKADFVERYNLRLPAVKDGHPKARRKQ